MNFEKSPCKFSIEVHHNCHCPVEDAEELWTLAKSIKVENCKVTKIKNRFSFRAHTEDMLNIEAKTLELTFYGWTPLFWWKVLRGRND